MYLPSKFIKSKLGASLLIILAIVVYLLFKGFIKDIFVYFYSNCLVSQSKLNAKITVLKADNLRLSLEKDACAALKKENERLKSILRFKESHSLDVIPLRIINMVPSRFKRTIFVKAISDSKIRDGCPVLNEKGFLIGRISKTYNGFSELTLINDPDFFISVRIKNSIGLLRGTLYGALKVYYIDNNEEIKKGDKVWAVSYLLDKEFLVGRVIKAVKSADSFFMDIIVEPYFEFSPSRVVFAVQ